MICKGTTQLGQRETADLHLVLNKLLPVLIVFQSISFQSLNSLPVRVWVCNPVNTYVDGDVIELCYSHTDQGPVFQMWLN